MNFISRNPAQETQALNVENNSFLDDHGSLESFPFEHEGYAPVRAPRPSANQIRNQNKIMAEICKTLLSGRRV